MNDRRFVLLVLLLGLTAVIVACGGVQETSEKAADAIESVAVTRVVTETEEVESAAEAPMEEPAESSEALPAATGSEGLGDEPPAPDTGEKVDGTSAATRTATEVTLAEAPVVAEVEMVRADGDTEAVGALDSPERATTADSFDSSLPLDQNSRLTAGEVDDNKEWDAYFQYLRSYQGASVIPVDVSQRHQIWVEDSQGDPVLGAVIAVEADGQPIARLRTHSNGRSYFFPRAYTDNNEDYLVTITVNNQEETFTIPADSSQREWVITHPGADQAPQPQAQLDILFLIDATGSMADEINQLKENIRAISARIDEMPSQPDVRFGMVTYRDRGDEYITQVTDFTPDVEDFAQTLAQVSANGGGDYPEDLNEALSQAVHQPEWRVAETVSLIFLVADAPPHLDYGQQNHYAVEMLQAATRGIKIYPIASSGLDEQGEYIFRQLAQTTGGRFIFLTYGEDGPGSTGTETEFQVSDYTVSSLDDMVIKIVEEELAPLTRQ